MMDGICSTYQAEESYVQDFRWGNPRKRGYLKDIGVDGKVILKYILKTQVGWAWGGLIWPGMGTSYVLS